MIRIRTAFLGVLLSLVGLIAAAQTVDVGGAKFDETIDVRGTKLILNGAGVRYKAWQPASGMAFVAETGS